MLTDASFMADEGPKPDWVKSFALFSQVLAEVLGYTAAGIGFGYLAVRWLGAPSWAFVITGLGSLCALVFRLYWISQRD